MEERDLPQLGDWNSFGELNSLQQKYLRNAFITAKNSSYYETIFPTQHEVFSMEDLKELPVITKDDLRSAYPFGMLAVSKEQLASYHESSGTSGEPTSSYFTEHDWLDIADRFNRNRVNLSAEDTILIKTPYAMLTTAHQMHHAARLRKSTIIPADNRSSIMSYTRVIRLLHDLPVSVAWCMPTEPLFWAKAAKILGYDTKKDFPKLREFLVAGEALSEAKRNRMKEIWGGTRITQDYGSTETGSLAGECPHGNLHLWADRFIFEVYDEGKQTSTKEGVGQLLITSLFREAMPLVRYNLGDLVKISYDHCDCGWNLPTVRVLGRANSSPVVQGRQISSLELEEIIYDLPEKYGVFFWRARHNSTKLDIEIEAFQNQGEFAKNLLKEKIKSNLQIEPNVSVVEPGTIVSDHVLTSHNRFAKPRFLFEENEDWSKAVLY